MDEGGGINEAGRPKVFLQDQTEIKDVQMRRFEAR